MKRFLLFLLVLVFILLIIISFNTFRFTSKQISKPSERKIFPVDTNAVNHLSDAIKCKSISYDEDSLTNYSGLDSLLSFLRTTYPSTFNTLDPEIINQHSLLLHWKGNNSTAKPVIFYAHLDVVPADSAKWKFNPFDGYIDSEFIYGRGAVDDKGSLIAIFESVEKLLRQKFIPIRDIYFAFGHDEECGGEKGASMIAEVLKRKNVNAEFLIDEGGLVAEDMVPFVKNPVALIFTSEKGYLTLKLSVTGDGGHSSHPPKEPPVEILSAALQKIYDNPFENRMTQSVSDFMDFAGPEMRFPFKSLFANRWLFKPVIFSEYKKISSAYAMIHTTSVTTVIHGGNKDNVIPNEVFAEVNFRLLPGDSIELVVSKVKNLIADERISISKYGDYEEPSGVSSIGSESFKLLQNTIGKIFPDAVVAPSLMIAQTDSRHFRNVTENIYRFLPVRMNNEILDSMHGLNEKIRKKDFMEAIAFYEELIKNL